MVRNLNLQESTSGLVNDFVEATFPPNYSLL